MNITLEEILSDKGDEPFSSIPDYKQFMAFINGKVFIPVNDTLTPDTPCDVILTKIYSLDDIDKQQQILTRIYKAVDKKDRYKNLLMILSLCICLISAGIVINVVKSDQPISSETIEFFKFIGGGLIDLLKLLLST